MPFGNLRNEMPHRQEKKTAKCKQPLFPEKKYVFESKCNWRENSDFELFKNEWTSNVTVMPQKKGHVYVIERPKEAGMKSPKTHGLDFLAVGI